MWGYLNFDLPIITLMKHTYLSNFQKQQYTNYLETQLQKFSAFMLSQRKENDRFHSIEEVFHQQTALIQQMRSKIELMELHQNQNYEACEHLFKKQEMLEKMEARVSRLEDRDRFGCDDELKRRASKSYKEVGHAKEKDAEKLDEIHSELSRKIRKIEEEINRKKEANIQLNKIHPFSSDGKENILSIENIVERKDLKKLEKKMKRYFSQKFEQIESIMKKSQKKRSKSPSSRSPIEAMVQSQQDNFKSNKVLSEFKLHETVGKSEISTVSRISKNTNDQSRGKIKQKLKKRSKSRSKSQKSSKNKSKSRKQDKSLSLNQSSIVESSISRSKSKSNNSKLDKSFKKKTKRQKIHKRDVSISKSAHSTNSHQNCKKQHNHIKVQPPKTVKPKRDPSPQPKKKQKRLR